jgi:hypothetical protein
MPTDNFQSLQTQGQPRATGRLETQGESSAENFQRLFWPLQWTKSTEATFWK